MSKLNFSIKPYKRILITIIYLIFQHIVEKKLLLETIGQLNTQVSKKKFTCLYFWVLLYSCQFMLIQLLFWVLSKLISHVKYVWHGASTRNTSLFRWELFFSISWSLKF